MIFPDYYAARPIITRQEMWSAEAVHRFCIAHDFYGNGTAEEFSAMLKYVGSHGISLKTLYNVASDIHRHSGDGDLTVGAIMTMLDKEAVNTVFEILDGADYE